MRQQLLSCTVAGGRGGRGRTMATAMASSPRRRPRPTAAAASTRPPRAAALTHPMAGAPLPGADPIGRAGLCGTGGEGTGEGSSGRRGAEGGATSRLWGRMRRGEGRSRRGGAEGGAPGRLALFAVVKSVGKGSALAGCLRGRAQGARIPRRCRRRSRRHFSRAASSPPRRHERRPPRPQGSAAAETGEASGTRKKTPDAKIFTATVLRGWGECQPQIHHWTL